MTSENIETSSAFLSFFFLFVFFLIFLEYFKAKFKQTLSLPNILHRTDDILNIRIS